MKQTYRVLSPAKVNLYLEIGEKRNDGFHEAKTVMQTLTLHDMVTVSIDDGVDEFIAPEGYDDLSINIDCSTRENIPALEISPEENIAYKAAARLAKKLGHEREHISIRIEKHIPFQAGLGGGSSNAAAVIAGLCQAWGKGKTCEEAIDVARSLGADVAFFLYGPCAYLDGKGDTFQHAVSPLEREVVIVKIDEGVSTKAAYEAFDSLEKRQPSAFYPSTDKACDIELFNNLAAASESILPKLSEVRLWLSSQPGVATGENGEPKVLLCGSGSATFAIMKPKTQPGDSASIVANAKLQGFWARSCTFSKIGVAVLPASGSSSNLGAAREIW